ncbi:MAG TPA: ABC transporter permease subunit [Planctomicrobium sp.]|nr:ABC transporter permease subunit [Planctomicrobium sp.]
MRLLRQEWRLLRANRAYWITLLLLGLLTALAFQIGWSRAQRTAERDQRYRAEQAELHLLVKEAVHDQSEKEVRRTMMKDPPVDLEQLFNRPLNGIEKGRFRVLWNFAKGRFSIPHLPWRTWKSPSSLEALSVGESDHWPSFYAIGKEWMGRTFSPPSLSNPFQAMIGALDLSTLLTVLLPLFVIVVLHDFVSGDREQGTLRLILSQNVSFRKLMLTRLLVRVSGIILTVLLVVVAGLILTGTDLSDEHTLRLLGVFSLSLVAYTLFWSSVAWLVNSLGLTSVTNAVLMTMCWVVLVIVLPLGVSRVVAGRHPVIPLNTLAAKEIEIRALIRKAREQQQANTPQNEERQERRRRTEEEWVNSFIQDHWIPQRQAITAEITQVFQNYQSRSDALDACGIWSPAFAIKNTCDLLSGNSLSQSIEFSRKTGEFHAEFLAHFEQLPHRQSTITVEDFQKMPVFQPAPADRTISWEKLRTNVMTLAIWSAIPFLIGWIGFRPRLL